MRSATAAAYVAPAGRPGCLPVSRARRRRSPRGRARRRRTVDLELGQEIEHEVGHRAGGVPPAKRRRGPVARQVGNDQRPMAPSSLKLPAELLGRAEEAVTEHQGFALAADEVAERLAADLDEPLVHHGQCSTSVFGRDPGGQGARQDRSPCINGAIKDARWVAAASGGVQRGQRDVRGHLSQPPGGCPGGDRRHLEVSNPA